MNNYEEIWETIGDLEGMGTNPMTYLLFPLESSQKTKNKIARFSKNPLEKLKIYRNLRWDFMKQIRTPNFGKCKIFHKIWIQHLWMKSLRWIPNSSPLILFSFEPFGFSRFFNFSLKLERKSSAKLPTQCRTISDLFVKFVMLSLFFPTWTVLISLSVLFPPLFVINIAFSIFSSSLLNLFIFSPSES